MKHNTVMVAIFCLSIAAPSADRSSVWGQEQRTGVAARESSTIHDVLVSTLDVSIPSTDFETGGKNLETIVRESFVGVPENFAIRFDGKRLASIGITKGGRIIDFTFKQRTVAEILTSFVVAMNYNRELGDPSHPRQRIVWTIAPDPRDPEGAKVVLITSRHSVESADYKLPPEFLPKENRGDAMKFSGTALDPSRR